MPRSTDPNKVVDFPQPEKRRPSSTERIWGKAVLSHGYAGVPSLMIRAQKRLGLSPLQMNIIVQLLDYCYSPDCRPYPSKKSLADRIRFNSKTIQNNIRKIEKYGLIKREFRRTAVGDWNSNAYHLDGLVDRVRKLEPEFTEKRKDDQQIEMPVGLRGA